MKINILLLISTLMIEKLITSVTHKQTINESIINKSIEKKVNLSTNIIKIETRIIIKNNEIDPVDLYKFPILRNNSKNLLHFEANMLSFDEETSIPVKILRNKPNENQSFQYISYEISFNKDPMNYDEERILIIIEYYTNKFQLLPKAISILDNQSVLFEDSTNSVSFYKTSSQKTIFIFKEQENLDDKKSSLISYNKENSMFDEDNNLVYILNDSIDELVVLENKIHFIYNHPLYEFTSSEKVIDVSHWGNINIEERFNLLNSGAKHVGEFGRVDFSKGGKSSLTGLYASLPLRANNLWYRDEIGNVSTSQGERSWDDVVMKLEFRFPILGGWKNIFYIGYSLPSKFHITDNGSGQYKLSLNYGIPFKNVISKGFSLKINLPENAEIERILLPIQDEYRVSYDKTYSTLDSFGRRSVIISMNNLFYIHNDVILEVYYKYSSFWLIFKPFILSLFIFMSFLLVIVVKRVSLSLEKEKKNK